MLERAIIDHASPTLANLKLGSLFSHPVESGFCREFAALRDLLRKKGVRMTILKVFRGRALIYVYRPERLGRDLQQACTAELLQEYGYCPQDPGMCLGRLAGKLKASRCGDTFPHEIGCFLGYPPEDVRCFIHKDRPCLYQGLWQVYTNVEEAKETLRRWHLCTECYLKHLQAGRTLYDLAVAEG